MRSYHCLEKQRFELGSYFLVPLRDEDKFDIMLWRNSQMYHLRQNTILSREDQQKYFSETVAKLFVEEQPDQVLFSYLQDNTCLGYGGLVHINWHDQNAEISFLINTDLEEESFEFHWINYLKLIQEVAFSELKLHKIYTYAFDLRPKLYSALETSHFSRDARLKEHARFNDQFVDVVIHSKINERAHL